MIGQSNIFKLILGGLLAFAIGVVVLNFVSYNRRQNTFELSKKSDASHEIHSRVIPLIQSKGDFKSNIEPKKLIKNADNKINIFKIPIQTYRIALNNKQYQNILVHTAGRGNYHILLLHGQNMSSEIWKKIGTIQYLSNWGYRAVAIDIPSSKNHSLSVIKDKEAVELLTKLIDKLRLSNVVIVSPSINIRLTLPYIFQLPENQKLIRGFVPIDPIGINNYNVNDYKHVKIPTLIVHGDGDTNFQSSLNTLKQIPNNEILSIKNVTSDGYYKRPVYFHNGLRQFLYKVYRPIYKDSLLSNTTKLRNKQQQHRHQ